ncbi:MAG TPA: hypothetical protein VGZ00_03690 [Candidatus Baltobacteraceae bacterium]|nr:hypothetical protein [Candidatus Baltobacteraceae bacterium]
MTSKLPENNSKNASAMREELDRPRDHAMAIQGLLRHLREAKHPDTCLSAGQSIHRILKRYDDSGALKKLFQGRPDVELDVAVVFLHGLHGFEPDARKACRLAEWAAEQNFPEAWNKLAEWYQDGKRDIVPDNKKADEYAAKAREALRRIAQRQIAQTRPNQLKRM